MFIIYIFNKGKYFEDMPKVTFTKKSLIIAVMADESTVTGFLLTGIGQRGKDGSQSFYIVNKETTDEQLEQEFQKWLNREDIGIIMIG